MSILLAPWGWIRSLDARRSTTAGPHADAGRLPTGVPGVFGPLHPTRTRIVLDYHGLLNHPAGALVQIAARHNVTTRTVANNIAAVRAAGRRLPLSAPLIAEATRVSTQGDDHLGRVRIAATLGCPPHDPHRSTRQR